MSRIHAIACSQSNRVIGLFPRGIYQSPDIFTDYLFSVPEEYCQQSIDPESLTSSCKSPLFATPFNPIISLVGIPIIANPLSVRTVTS